MPILQVRDISEDLYEQLRVCAKQQNRSISQQTITILQEFLQAQSHPKESATGSFSVFSSFDTAEERQARIEKRKKLFAELDNEDPISLPEGYSSIVELLHECREERC